MNDNRIESIINSDVQTKGLHLLENRPSVGSLSASDQLASDEMEKFWLNSRNIQNSIITGCETFPGEMLNPSSENVLLPEKIIDLMVNFYTDTYVTYEFCKPADELIQSSIMIRIIMNQFERCRIGSEVFGSLMSNWHIKSSYVLANFVTDNGDIDCYPGQVQYYFKHIVDLPTGPSEHNLAFIRWYKPADTANLRYYFTIDEICNVELWKPDFYPESRDCIIPVHNILGRFVPTKYQISTRSNAVEYIAINPINRKLHIC